MMNEWGLSHSDDIENELRSFGLAQASAPATPFPTKATIVGTAMGTLVGALAGWGISGPSAEALVATGVGAALGGFAGYKVGQSQAAAAPVTAGATAPTATCTTLKPGVMPVVAVSVSDPMVYRYCLPDGATLMSAAPSNVGQGEAATNIYANTTAFAADGEIAISAWSTSAPGNASAVIQWMDASGTAQKSTIPVSVTS
ncbi:MAG TPA: hypothetical protein VMI75_04475 [Polyangiaceae bacterium]|nr:hypothetical protein [Polyangiaceae bacterium]